MSTAQKTIFSFSRCPEKVVFPKTLYWNMISLVLSGEMIFLFPKNMILQLGREMKDDLSQKNTQKYNIFFKLSEKMVFSKRSFLYYLERLCFFRKHAIFSLGRKWEITFLKKYTKIYFLCTCTGVTNVAPRPSVEKNKDGLILQKYT